MIYKTSASQTTKQKSSTEEIRVGNEFTAIIEQDDEWHIGYCPEIPGVNVQGKTV
jgi:hypothetical protein